MEKNCNKVFNNYKAMSPFDNLYQMGSFFLVIDMKPTRMWDTTYQ